MSDTDIHDIANARIEALAEAINILARRKPRPSDMAILIEAGSPLSNRSRALTKTTSLRRSTA